MPYYGVLWKVAICVEYHDELHLIYYLLGLIYFLGGGCISQIKEYQLQKEFGMGDWGRLPV